MYCLAREMACTIGMIISVASLVLTLMVYVALSELRTGPGKNLICLAASLLLAYTFLVALRLFSDAWPKWTCIPAGWYQLDIIFGNFSLFRKIIFQLLFMLLYGLCGTFIDNLLLLEYLD